MKPISTCSILLVWMTAFATVNAADPPSFSGPLPGMGEARLVGDHLALRRGLPRVIFRTRTGTSETGETFSYEVPLTVNVPRDEAVAPGDYRVLDMQGNPVDHTVLAQRLSQFTLVLVSEDGRKVDPQYLVLYKPDTLIVYLRPQRPQLPHDGHGKFGVDPKHGPLPAPAPAPVPAAATPGRSA